MLLFRPLSAPNTEGTQHTIGVCAAAPSVDDYVHMLAHAHAIKLLPSQEVAEGSMHVSVQLLCMKH